MTQAERYAVFVQKWPRCIPFVRHTSPVAYRVLRQFAGMDDEDIESECMMVAWKACKRFNAEVGDNICAYVTTSIQNHVLCLAKAASRKKRKHAGAQVSFNTLRRIVDDNAGRAVEAIDAFDAVSHAMRTLHERKKRIIRSHVWEHESIKHIAEHGMHRVYTRSAIDENYRQSLKAMRSRLEKDGVTGTLLIDHMP